MALGYGRTGTNNFATAKFIVDSNGLQTGATHTTIQGAIADASAGDTIVIRPGTYTEDITLTDELTLYGLNCDIEDFQPKIVGKISLTSGSANVISLNCATNGDFAGANSSTGALNFHECRMDGDDNTILSNTGSGIIRVRQGTINLNTTGIKIYENTGGGVFISRCSGGNGGVSTTASTSTSGTCRIEHCNIPFAFSASGGAFRISHSIVDSGTISATTLSLTGTATALVRHSSLISGTQSTVSIGSGTTATIAESTIESSNANVLTGAGTLNYGHITFTGSSSNTNVTTENELDVLPAGGGAIPNEVFYFKATDFDALETNFAPLVQDNGTNAKVMVRAFDDSTEEYVNFSLKVPADIDTSGSVTFRVWMYAATAAASKNVALTFDHRPLDNSESWDQTYTSEDSGDIAIDATQDDITEATWTETVTNLSWAAHDIVLCRLSRPNATANDLTGDLYVLGFAVEVPRA